ncbi:MAG: Peptidase, family [Chthoniobacteraceae bacterium]|nr:Peptidase, family [Chthoniobacteraceae bacterium]
MNSTKRRIGFKLRNDLQVSHQHRDGIDRAVIKDPHSLRFFEMAWSDYQLATTVQNGGTAPEIIEQWRRSFPELCDGIEQEALERRAERLCIAARRLGLVEESGPLRAIPSALGWGAWLLRWVRWIGAPMAIRIRLFDPDAFLSQIVARWRPLFSLPALFLASVFVIVSLIAALSRFDEMEFHAEWFHIWQNLAALYLGILVLKVVHESGHALVCKTLGGHVHEVGAQLLVFHPTFFVDVSDTWMWPDRRRRIAVAAAGFGAEMIAAAFLFWLWRLLSPGFARDLCLNLMFIASVSAVLFNINPLMRYDGYHMLADLLREPRLRQKAFASIGLTIRRFFFGKTLVPVVFEKHQTVFTIYGILSTAYLIWIVVAVGGFLRHLLAPLGLEAAGRVLLAAWLCSMLLPLLGFFGKIIRDTFQLSALERRRPIVVWASLISTGIFAAFMPLPIRVERECVVEVAAAGVVRASQAGFLKEVLVREGERVKKGQLLARLENRAIALTKTKAEIEVGLTKVALMSAVGGNQSGHVQQGMRRFNEARANELEAERRSGALELLSPCDGIVLTRLLERKQRQFIRPGEEVISVAPENTREIMLPLTEKEARRIKEGARVEFRAKAFSGSEFTGRISTAPLRIKGGDLPRALTALAGGDITVDASGKVFSSEVTHVSRFIVEPADLRLRQGLTGRARLDCGTLPAARWLWEKALDAIHLEHRM